MPEMTPAASARRFFNDSGLDVRGCTILVAVSGGADSVCLLHVLAGLSDDYGYRLHVAHLNHRLRGADADEDAYYVAALAGRMGLPATVEARDVEAYRQEHHLSPEEAAREVRYAFLGETAEAAGAAYIAVGHTADDRVETVLMNLLRGTGLRGLRGLLPVSSRPVSPGRKMTIIRPLLEVTRQATSDYCRENNLETRLDATNLAEVPFRNRVRHRLLPLLRSFNPQVNASLLRTARLAADDIDFIDTEVARIVPAVLQEKGGVVIIDKPGVLSLHPALRRYVLRAALKKLRGDLKDIEAAHIEDMMAALEKPAGRVIGLPDRLWLAVEYDRFVLGEDTSALCPLPPLAGESVLSVPGTSTISGWSIIAELISPEQAGEAGIDESGYAAYFDADEIGTQLTVRARRTGDRFVPLGMTGEKKLNRFMMDERIPRSWRARVPLLVTGETIAWVAGWRIDDRFKVTAATRRVLRVTFTRCEP